MSFSVHLRLVTPEDDAFLFQVYSASRATEMAFAPWGEDQKLEFLRFQFDAQNRHYKNEFPAATHHIIAADGQPVGRIYVDRRPDEIRILDIALLEEHRGAGIGTKLISDLLAEARAAGKSVTIYVESFQRSIGLFERLGFVRTPDQGAVLLMEWRAEST